MDNPMPPPAPVITAVVCSLVVEVVEVVDGERRDGGICEDCIICPVINDDGDVRKNAVFVGRGEVEVDVDVGDVDVGEVDDDDDGGVDGYKICY